ncbi:MAG TPA: hypothetical protein VMA77_04215, partial [Solirubrobacteraceae bacterium]|nr:hypothetical protein [Solirubrobacteraceae bacterium]
MSAIGLPLTRPDGPAKATGAARYVADTPVDGLTHAALVMSSIPAGTVTAIDTAAALAAAGVLAVITHENAPRVAPLPNTSGPFEVLQSDVVLYEGQAVAVVVAESFEQAQQGAELVEVSYERREARLDFRDHLADTVSVNTFQDPDSTVGDVDAALSAEAEVVVDEVYRTADRHQNPMENLVTLAEWHEDD